MPVQQQMSSFAKKLGGRVAQANEEHRDKPIDTGNRRLPSGIRSGVAKLSAMYTKEYGSDSKNGMEGQTFFRASAIVVSPEEHNGEKIAGMVTQVMIPLCDIPAKGERKAKPFSEQWFEFQNLFKLLGVAPCPETPQTDPTGQRTEAYFFAAMKMLTDPVRQKTNPTYIEFSTRGWTPPPTAQQPKPEEMVFETWHGLAKFDGKVDPGAGVSDIPPNPPTMAADGLPVAAPNDPLPTAPPQAPPPQDMPDREELVAALVEVAMNDPDGATEEGASASGQLEELAWAMGWTKEQTAEPPAPYSNDWAGVGDMALNAPDSTTTTPTPSTNGVAVGTHWLFAKRTKDGGKLKDGNGKEFPPQEVEVVTVNEADQTCTVKTVKTGKDVVDIRSKQPVQVKFEWLEPVS